MTHLIGTLVPGVSPPILAQAGWIEGTISFLSSEVFPSLLNLGEAILILIVGWLIAVLAKSIVLGILNRTEIDNKIANWMAGGRDRGESIPIEQWVGTLVYWIIFLFAIVAFLNALELTAVSEPLNELLTQVTGFLPQLGGAAVLLGLAWLIATIVKLILTQVLETFRLDERLNQGTGSGQVSLSGTIANALYWFIFLLFLPSILSTLQLDGTLAPVQSMLDEILSALPNILKAVLIGSIGWFIAQLVRRIVTNLLAATGINQIGNRFGLSGQGGRQSLSQIIGTFVFVLVLIPTIITALEALAIEAISDPATTMLEVVLAYIPLIFSASAILVLAYVAGGYVAELVTSILTSLGFNNIFQWLGLPSPTTAPPDSEETTVQTKTPSEILGTVAQIAVVLIATFAAVDILQVEALQIVVGVILYIVGQIFLGVIILGIGLYVANFAFGLIVSSGSSQSRVLGHTARIAIIAFVIAMALERIGVATNIVNLAFGLLLGAIAVAIALAFGLGGRDIAAEYVKEWLDSFKKGS